MSSGFRDFLSINLDLLRLRGCCPEDSAFTFGCRLDPPRSGHAAHSILRVVARLRGCPKTLIKTHRAIEMTDTTITKESDMKMFAISANAGFGGDRKAVLPGIEASMRGTTSMRMQQTPRSLACSSAVIATTVSMKSAINGKPSAIGMSATRARRHRRRVIPAATYCISRSLRSAIGRHPMHLRAILVSGQSTFEDVIAISFFDMRPI